ncbi:MAG: HAMP domain-containing histidine kinase [Bacteroidales bacterium]|nr:HAMP domain-containing histidine kinase [Bacteroides sp.]MCM1197474.1 HAMP domain-containing histidine kinase [Clostridium sp.]MCM1502275.1 HAMP domain-containing histidine kinase [Bacteroidales bacterium]
MSLRKSLGLVKKPVAKMVRFEEQSFRRILLSFSAVFAAFAFLVVVAQFCIDRYYWGRFPSYLLFFLIVAILCVIALISIIIISKYFDNGISRLHDRIIQEREKYREMKQQMSNNVAHELRTPVSSIRGYLETLLTCENIDPERKRSFIDKAYKQSIRLSDLIRDIALITKIEEASDQLLKETLNVRRIAEDVFDELRDSIAERGDVIENTLPPDLTLKGNQTLIYAIFRNLVENSVKYAGKHITIHIECTLHRDGSCDFIYYDTGVGVHKEHRERIFERFYRLTEGRTRDAGGSGLGLSIVRNAVAFHGGTIAAYRHNGGGLEYRFTMKDCD